MRDGVVQIRNWSQLSGLMDDLQMYICILYDAIICPLGAEIFCRIMQTIICRITKSRRSPAALVVFKLRISSFPLDAFLPRAKSAVSSLHGCISV